MDLSFIKLEGERTKREDWKSHAVHWKLNLNGVMTVFSEGMRHFVCPRRLVNRNKLEDGIYQAILDPEKKVINQGNNSGFPNRKTLNNMVTNRVSIDPSRRNRLLCSLPSIEAVLYGLTMDALQAQPTFKGWCVATGYEASLEVARITYRKHQSSLKKLRLLGLRLDELKYLFEGKYQEA